MYALPGGLQPGPIGQSLGSREEIVLRDFCVRIHHEEEQTAAELGHYTPHLRLKRSRAAQPREQVIALVPTPPLSSTVSHQSLPIQAAGHRLELVYEVVFLASKDGGQLGGDEDLMANAWQ